MKVLFVSLDFMIPADRGLRVRSLSQLRVLSSVPAVDTITVLSLSDAPVAKERLEALEREVPKVRAEPAVLQPTHMRRSPRSLPRLLWLRLRGVPYLIAKHDNPGLARLVEKHLRREPYDIIYLGHLGVASVLARGRRLAPGARFVLEEHNVEWAIFERLAPTFQGLMRHVARLEARALRRFERDTLRAVDSVVAISEADAQSLRTLSGVTATVVPNHIELGPTRTERVRSPSLAYTGHLAWQPNTQGLDWFCAEVWPLIRRRLPQATLVIAGPGLRRSADGAFEVPTAWSKDGIQTVGYVPDLEDLYQNCVAMVAPIVGGSGVRMKLLESMRAGMPTVTTTDGAAGLAVQNGREMLIADEPAVFADEVVRLLSDENLRDRIRTAGYAYLEAHHSLSVARGRLEEALFAGAGAGGRRTREVGAPAHSPVGLGPAER